MGKQRGFLPGLGDTDIDRFPTLEEGLQRVIQTSTLGDIKIRRIDIRFDAAGHGHYRYWEGRDDDFGAGAAPRD